MEDYEENEFSDLLSSYIDDELSNHDEESELSPLKETNWEGCNYWIPIKENELKGFERLTVDVENDQIFVKEHYPRLTFISDSSSEKEERFYIYLHGVYNGDVEYLSFPIYKKGEPDIIKNLDVLFLKGKYLIDCSNLKQTLTPGDYFIVCQGIVVGKDLKDYAVLENNLVITLRVLSLGETLQHPDIQSACVVCRNEEMQFQAEGLLTDWDALELLCYTDSYHLVGKGKIWGNHVKDKNLIHLSIHSDYPWISQCYKILLLHNKEPYAYLDCWYEEGNTIVTEVLNLSKDSLYYILAKYMYLKDDYTWRLISGMFGNVELRKKYLELFRLKCLNELCKQSNLATFTLKNNMLCIGYEAEMYASIFKNISYDLWNSDHFVEVDFSRLAGERHEMSNYCELNDLFSSSGQKPFYFVTNISSTFTDTKALHLFLKNVKKIEQASILFVVEEKDVNTLFNIYPKMKDMFPSFNRMNLHSYNPIEFMYCICSLLANNHLSLSVHAKKELAHYISEIQGKGLSFPYFYEDVKQFVENGILTNFRNRVCQILLSGEMAEQTNIIEFKDFDLNCMSSNHQTFEEAMKELNAMVGFADLKDRLRLLFNNIRFNNLRRDNGLQVIKNNTYHMLFTGNPGTGKTTVAKMLGRIFHSLGILSKGEVIVAERRTIIGRYIGQTEQNMTRLLESAKGNILFIDEAYSLTDTCSDRKDFGYRVIECLLTVLSQPNPDMIIIFAGYKREIDQMMKANPGLHGRFPFTFHFNDYTHEELIQIMVLFIERMGYCISDEVLEVLSRIVQETINLKLVDFSNARWAEQFVMNGIIPAMATRVVENSNELSRELLQQITCSDVEKAYSDLSISYKKTGIQNNRVGFVA